MGVTFLKLVSVPILYRKQNSDTISWDNLKKVRNSTSRKLVVRTRNFTRNWLITRFSNPYILALGCPPKATAWAFLNFQKFSIFYFVFPDTHWERNSSVTFDLTLTSWTVNLGIVPTFPLGGQTKSELLFVVRTVGLYSSPF